MTDTHREGVSRNRLPQLPRDPAEASRTLRALPVEEASALFMRLSTDEQLAVLDATPDPEDREELYYLVPDCTELIQRTRVESLLEMVNTSFGTGLACGILSSVTPEQFVEMFERTVFKDGEVDRDIVYLWVSELTELEIEELSALLVQLDVELLAELFRGRIDVHGRYKGMAIDSGMVELEHVEFGDDEQARLMGELLWAADPELFIAMLRLLLTERDESDVAPEEGTPPVDEPEEKRDESETTTSGDDWLATFDMSKIDTILPRVPRRAEAPKSEENGSDK